jgi:hypothetical protein
MALDLDRVRQIAERVAGSNGLEVVEVEVSGAGKHRALRVFIDRPGAAPAANRPDGVTHEDCSKFSREFGTIVDVEDAVPGGSYVLEVSMASELYNVIDALSREKGIDPQIVVTAVEDAIVVATRKYYKTQENLRAELDKESGQIRAFAVRSIVEGPDQVEDPVAQITLDDAKRIDPAAEVGGELRTYKATDVLGRIAAQLAKQVIFQKVREAERDTIYNEYIGRVNEIINATVKRTEGQDVIVDLGKAEGRMPRKEQSRLESFAPGERARVMIVRVEKASKARRSWFLAPRRSWSRICSRPKCRKSTTTPSSSALSRAKPASAPRSRSCRRTRTSIPWAHASA